MAHHIFRRGGIPVLASLVSDVSLPSLCSLVVKHSEAHQQATIELHFRLPLHGFDDEQPIHLLCNPDNLVAGLVAVEPNHVSPPQALLDQIARNKGRHLRLLSLHLKSPCVVRCPRSLGSIAPQSKADPLFTNLVGLAKATRLHILFDYDWLHPSKASRFQHIVTHPDTLSAFRADDFSTNTLRWADWTVFSPALDVNVASEAPPPAYEDTPNKRRRQVTGSPSSPSAKRLLLSPAPLSPTEKATTTTASPSPRSSPFTSSLNLQEAVNNALQTLLPNALQQVLPEVIARLLATPPSSPSSSASMSHQPLPMLQNLIRAHLTARAEAVAEQMTRDVLDHADDLRAATHAELEEDLDDYRVDVTMLKEDGISDLNRLFDDKLEEFKESATGIVESVETQTLEVYDAARERLNEFVERERAALASEREDLEQERRRIRRGHHIMDDQFRRAASLPLGL